MRWFKRKEADGDIQRRLTDTERLTKDLKRRVRALEIERGIFAPHQPLRKINGGNGA